MSQQSSFQYRLDYLLRLVRAGIEVFSAVMVISVFYSNTSSILGWSHWEAMLVYGFFQSITSLVFVFTGYGITELPNNIIRGRLDQYLVKPIDSQFLVCTSFTYITNIYRSLLGLMIVLTALSHLHLVVNLVVIMLTLVSLASGAVIYYCLSFSISTLAFWTMFDEMSEIMSTLTSISRYPADYFRTLKRIFYLFPIAFIATVPAQALLYRNYLPALLSPLVAILALVTTRHLWLAGLWSYQSASS